MPDLLTHEPDEAPLPRSLKQLREQAEACRRCPLYRDATQMVFGEGAAHAPIMFVGEVPGDQEDREGHPFVGPAGKLFDRALVDAGIDRKRAYVTNAVKHFKYEMRGKRRLHKRPNAYEIDRCKWWLDGELALVKPDLAVALGATAARALFGRLVTISSLRGRFVILPSDIEAFVTVHPSSLLRQPDEASRAREYGRFVTDLKTIVRHVPAIRG